MSNYKPDISTQWYHRYQKGNISIIESLISHPHPHTCSSQFLPFYYRYQGRNATIFPTLPALLRVWTWHVSQQVIVWLSSLTWSGWNSMTNPFNQRLLWKWCYAIYKIRSWRCTTGSLESLLQPVICSAVWNPKSACPERPPGNPTQRATAKEPCKTQLLILRMNSRTRGDPTLSRTESVPGFTFSHLKLWKWSHGDKPSFLHQI